ncbi:MAG: hypothetical protein ACREHD_34605 [Pirellulales bacterium]
MSGLPDVDYESIHDELVAFLASLASLGRQFDARRIYKSAAKDLGHRALHIYCAARELECDSRSLLARSRYPLTQDLECLFGEMAELRAETSLDPIYAFRDCGLSYTEAAFNECRALRFFFTGQNVLALFDELPNSPEMPQGIFPCESEIETFCRIPLKSASIRRRLSAAIAELADDFFGCFGFDQRDRLSAECDRVAAAVQLEFVRLRRLKFDMDAAFGSNGALGVEETESNRLTPLAQSVDQAIRQLGECTIKELVRETGHAAGSITNHAIPELKEKRGLLSRPYHYPTNVTL